MQRLWDKEVN